MPGLRRRHTGLAAAPASINPLQPSDLSAPVPLTWSDRSPTASNCLPPTVGRLIGDSARYRHGRGTPKDNAAAQWCAKGAALERTSAQIALAEMCYDGMVQRDRQTALRWFCSGRNGSDSEAQYMLYTMYDSGGRLGIQEGAGLPQPGGQRGT